MIVVVHDNDLMKIGGSPLKVWEATAEQLRAVDIGSGFDPKFNGERVPTREALAACKGVSRGHRLRIADTTTGWKAGHRSTVEAAGCKDTHRHDVAEPRHGRDETPAPRVDLRLLTARPSAI